MTARTDLGEASLGRLRLALDDDLGLLSPEDIENASEERIRAILDRYDVQPPEGLPDLKDGVIMWRKTSVEPMGATGSGWDLRPADTWIVKRPRLVDAALAAFAQSSQIILEGPRGSGKSHFWRQDLRRAPDFAKQFAAAVPIDCFSLVMDSPWMIEQEALYAQFGANEQGYRAFVERLDSGEKNPLRVFIREKFERMPGLVVLEHTEHLSNCGEVQLWLKEFAEWIRASGNSLMVVVGGTRPPVISRALGGALPTVRVDALSLEEISSWWSQDCFAPHEKAGLGADDIFRLTGGWPRLVRDFGRLIEQESLESPRKAPGRGLLGRFVRLASQSVAPEIDRVIQILCERPRLIDQPLKVSDKALVQRLVESGAIIRQATGALRFRSPILARRYRHLTRETSLRVLFHAGPDERIIAYKTGVELAGTALGKTLMMEEKPWRAFRRICAILRHWKLDDARVYVRDPANAKLWCLVFTDGAEGASTSKPEDWPLYADQKPEFALAVQSGRIVHRNGSRVFLPTVGSAGRVETVIDGRLALGSDSRPYDLRVAERSLWRLAMKLRPAIALAVDRLALRRSVRQQRTWLHRSRNATQRANGTLYGMLMESSCAAVLVLEKGPKGWFIAKAEEILRPNPSGSELAFEGSWEFAMSFPSQDKLEQIVGHPSRRGLVLHGEDLAETFPRLAEMAAECSLFLMPVWGNKGLKCRLVAFAFVGDDARALDGITQTHLSIIAPFAMSAA